MKVCYLLTHNYMLALLLFALVMQVLLLPFSIKQQKNNIRQAQLAPKIAALRKKYAGRTDAATQQKMQEETMALYKRENYSPASGCLPLLLQMPILFALVNVVYNPLRYITGLSAARITELQTYMTDTLGMEFVSRSAHIDVMNRILENPSQFYGIAPELEGAILPNMTFGPFDLSQVPKISFSPFDWLMLVPVLTFVFAMLTQIITRRFTYQSLEALEAQKSASMRIMNYSMPLLSVWIAFSVPAAIGLYWIFRNIVSCVQQIVLSKLFPTPHFTEEDYKRAEKEMKVGRPVREKSKTPPRSLHHIDDEEYQAKLAAAQTSVTEDEPTGEADTEEQPAPAEEDGDKEIAPPLKADEKVSYEKKITPSSGPKYEKTGKKYKK